MIPPLVDRGPGRPALGQTIGALAAFVAGLLLALMIAQNGALARATDPWLGSWLAHGVGSLVAAFLWWLAPRPPTPEAALPWAWLAGLDPWLLLGGVLGALFVAISSWAIGRVGALACALLIVTGQLAGAHCSMP
jgi:transporter family-2 protein